VASARGLAVGSGVAFMSGSVAGVLGNNITQGPAFWFGFIGLTALGAVVSGWLTYRAAEPGVPAAMVTHRGNSKVRSVRSKDGPAVGVNYGSVQGRPPKNEGTP
jgi:hypothetical protein